MHLHFQLNRVSATALYVQIVEQIKSEISSQRWPLGMRLPTIRRLAQELGVTRVTVQNAYDELQSGGWIESTIGRGTFVSSHAPARPVMRSLTQPMTLDTVINDIMQVSDLVGIRSLASASPDPQFFPADDFWQALDGLRDQVHSVVSYGASQGTTALRMELVKVLSERNIPSEPDDILITAGVTQALALVTQALCRPGDVVLVEQPTYLGFLHTIKAQGVQPSGVPMDEEGPQLEAVERLAIQQRPRFFYTIPTFQNPTGSCMSLARRRDLLALATRYGFLLVEDDIYARLAYDQTPPPPLKALDVANQVIYIHSFSKIFMPGLRLGYLVASPALQQKLLSLRHAADLCSPAILQLALARFLAAGGLKRHLRRALPIYRERRDVCLSALQRHMPPGVTWSRPAGGFCLWLTLPRQRAFQQLYQQAVERGWLFAPGEVFLAEPDAYHHLRLCFGNQPTDTIRQGVEALGNLIREGLEQGHRRQPEAHDWTPLV
jgi:DNA-binding transcriptional MocR family regulator